MDLANHRPLFLIAGAVFAGFVGWKLVRNIHQKEKMVANNTTRKSIEAPTKKNNCVAIRSDKKAYFLELMRLGEQCLAAGKYEDAVDHLSDAILYCDNKESLNEIFLTSLPKPIYEMFQNALKVKTESQLAQRNAKSCEENTVEKNSRDI